jgi:hypothetical protein
MTPAAYLLYTLAAMFHTSPRGVWFTDRWLVFGTEMPHAQTLDERDDDLSLDVR